MLKAKPEPKSNVNGREFFTKPMGHLSLVDSGMGSKNQVMTLINIENLRNNST
jgi:hypothetical protein